MTEACNSYFNKMQTFILPKLCAYMYGLFVCVCICLYVYIYCVQLLFSTLGYRNHSFVFRIRKFKSVEKTREKNRNDFFLVLCTVTELEVYAFLYVCVCVCFAYEAKLTAAYIHMIDSNCIQYVQAS